MKNNSIQAIRSRVILHLLKQKHTYPEISRVLNLSRETIYQIRQTPTYKAESLNIDKGEIS